MRGARARSTKQKARLERFEQLKAMDSPKTAKQVEMGSVGTRLGKKRLNFMIFQKHMETRYFLNIFPIYLNDLNELDLSGIMAVESPH